MLAARDRDGALAALFVVSFFWDFGDGKTTTERNPVHEYKKIDTFVISLTVADTVKEGARETVAELSEMGIDVVMLTGDARANAESVARDLGIRSVRAEVLPGDKAAAIAKQAHAERKTVREVATEMGIENLDALLDVRSMTE